MDSTNDFNMALRETLRPYTPPGISPGIRHTLLKEELDQ